jgi:hypothetical protein
LSARGADRTSRDAAYVNAPGRSGARQSAYAAAPIDKADNATDLCAGPARHASRRPPTAPCHEERSMNLRHRTNLLTALCAQLAHWWALPLIVLACASPAVQAGDDDDEAEPRAGGYCTATARLLFAACGAETRDDHLVAKAKCINIADARDRAQCLADAREARKEAAQTCRARLDGRRSACNMLGEARYDPPFTPERFDSDFRRSSNPNPYFPLGIGQRWVYLGEGERNVVEVTSETKSIEGVTCVVLRDLVYQDGRLKEATDDWYAAGRDGSTWYCGEEVKDYETFEGDVPRRPELVSRDGSFKHGVNGDKAGVIMPARPRAGQVYLEEFSPGNAEDVAEILSANYAYGGGALDHLVPRELALRLCGQRDCVVTRNFSLLQPGVYALKYYARGIGFFLETKPLEGKRLQLTECNFDARCVALPAP